MIVGRSGGPLGTASISVSNPQIDAAGEFDLSITYNFPMGTADSINQIQY
jgi:hypothetical protein